MMGFEMGRIGKALGVSLAVALGMTACSRDYTLGYVYVTSSRTALINAYAIDYQSGALNQLADSPIPASAITNANPVALVAAPNGLTIYVVNHDTSKIAPFSVGTDGKLYGMTEVDAVRNPSSTVIGTLPTAAAIDQLGQFLFVAFTFQNGFTAALPGPGGVAVYPITHSSDPSKEGMLGSPLINPATSAPYFPVGFGPSGLFVSVASSGAGFVYVVDQDHTATGAQQGVLREFAVNVTPPAGSAVAAGQLTIPANVTFPVQGGYAAGSVPSAVVADRGYVYVTDQATNQLYAFSSTSSGALTAINSSPFTTGQFPLGMTIDPRGQFLYVANFGSNTVSTFVRNLADGSLSGGGGQTVDTGPTCVTVDPALGIYLFTSNNRDSSVSSLTLNPHNGSLSQVQGTPFAASALPTCAVSIANGAHPTQLQD